MSVFNPIIPDKPTLIIGLGGVGSRIVESVYKQFDAHQPNGMERRNVSFLCFDTDENDINARKKVMPENSVVKTSSDLADTVGGYYERIKASSDVKNWFDTSSDLLLSLELNKGAAQVRMASRLALMASISEGKLRAVDNSITQLLANEPERHKGNVIRVYIISSLAGGTGAGSFLQMAYYVRNAMAEHSADSCYIDGFFVLADVLCDSTDANLNPDQIENTRSNTYACMKELIAFSSSEKDSGLRKIEFEYYLNQQNKQLPKGRPYDNCFLIDFSAPQGEHLSKTSNYYHQVAEFVYLQAFSPTGGEQRSKAINDLRQDIQSDGRKMFAGLGVSKLVYPVNDLFAYFAKRRVSENMKTTWCKIDKDFAEEYEAYRKDKREGIPHEEPKIGKFFRDNIIALSQNKGAIGTEFGEIYRSTQNLDRNLTPIGFSKAQEYFANVIKEIKDRTESNQELEDKYSDCINIELNFTEEDNEANDATTVDDTENKLHDYWKSALATIDSTKRIISKQCFLDDYAIDERVSKTPEEAKHHLNTFILKKDEEMHPLAVRYFLYDLRDIIKPALEEKQKNNVQTRDTIDSYFKNAYDIPETDDVVETAVDALRYKQDSNSGFGKKIGNFFTGQKPYRQWKKEYKTKSSSQAKSIQDYTKSKLEEEVLTSLLGYINRLLEESENFFNLLPDALREVETECEILLKQHDSATDKDITYVLASEQIKKDIYEFKISKNDSPFFPTVMSAALYRSMYDNVCEEFNDESHHASSREQDEEMLRQAAIDANKRIVEECIKYQDKMIRESNPEYADKNVIAALREEAEREFPKDKTKQKEYWEHKFKIFRDQALFYGPSHLENKDRYINAWGFHPDCVKRSGLTPQEIDALFGEEDIDANNQNNATRLPSKFFSPFEIVRANCVTKLSINQHFRKFHMKEYEETGKVYLGPYYTAYANVIKRVFETEHKSRAAVLKNDDDVIKECTVHLDKRWHLPAFMPNIGSTHMVEIQKLFRALCYGLLFDQYATANNGGKFYWKHKGSTTKWIKDIDKNLIERGNTLESAINSLFEDGLANNPGIVDEVLEVTEAEWRKAKENWLDTEHDESNELDQMKNLSLVKTIMEFRFAKLSYDSSHSANNKNWFEILNAKRGSTLYTILGEYDNFLIDDLFTDLINRFLNVFGPSYNTQLLCEHVFSIVGDEFKDDHALRVLSQYEQQKKFLPTE